MRTQRNIAYSQHAQAARAEKLALDKARTNMRALQHDVRCADLLFLAAAFVVGMLAAHFGFGWPV